MKESEITLDNQLTGEMQAFLDEQAVRGGYGSAAEYVVALIEHDQRQKAEEDLDMKLLEGLYSEGEELTEQLLEDIRNDALKRLKAKDVA